MQSVNNQDQSTYFQHDVGDLVTSRLGPILLTMSKHDRFRNRALRLAYRIERGQFLSGTARNILKTYSNVSIGSYSYGDCFVPGAFPPGSTIGRYVSIASGVRAFGRNHPVDRISMHPFFYNYKLGFVDHDTISTTPISVQSDAWIGHNAIMTPGCLRIGIGAVVGAGSVVTKDVPDFAIVAGNPAKILRYRFDEPVRSTLLNTLWWEYSIDKLVPYMESMIQSVHSGISAHPLVAALVQKQTL